ncbi:MAG TPA: DUF5916 domain-containing protein [Thermoanaerobaculia bacterium]|nr:DUF5916 domain-containing protein [Thermoanaerobaculia bacterium]
MRIPARPLAAVLAAALAAGPLAAGQAGKPAKPTKPLPPRNQFTVRLATSPIKVDAVLDEPAWANATVVPITHEWFPSDNVTPPVKTECLVTFDNDNLYVAFRAHDPRPAQIRAHLLDRDTALLDDTVGFYIDTFNDRRRAFEFRVNPLGVQMDAQLSDVDNTEDWSWNAIWDSAGRITADGFVVELALPLKQLRFPHGAGVQTWGFLASREYPRLVDHQLKSTYNDRSRNCRVCQFDRMTGFQQLDAGHNLEVVPTLVAKRNDARAALTAPLQRGNEKTDPGLWVRWGVTPSLTLNATLHPDFSQVEADVAQLNVNEAFALLFPEKRPFFLEGADYFGTPFPAVFTRTVADPTGGAKLTGKEGENAFGAYVAEDRLNNLVFPSNDSSSLQSVPEEIKSGVLRYRRDVGQTSTLGLLVTDREGDSYYNRVAGFDGSLRIADSNTLRFQLLNSQTDYPAAVAAAHKQSLDPFGGNAYRVDYVHANRDWRVTANYLWLDPGFRADSGFIPRVDYNGSLVSVQRTVWGQPDGPFSRLRFFVAGREYWDHRGELTDRGADIVLIYEGPHQSTVHLGFRPNPVETFHGVHYNDFRQDLTLGLVPVGDLTLGLYVRRGTIIDFVNARKSRFLLLRPTADFKIGRHISGTFQHDWQSSQVSGREFLRANLSQTTLRYNLTLRAFFRAIVQYREVHRVLALYTNQTLPEREKTLFTQLLFSYKLNPHTVLQVGWSDGAAATETIDLAEQSRAFFLKVGYAWLP